MSRLQARKTKSDAEATQFDEWAQGDVIVLRAALVSVAETRSLRERAFDKIRSWSNRGRTPAWAKGYEKWVVVTQTCDLVRPPPERPFVEIAPLVRLAGHPLAMASKGRTPRFAPVPQLGDDAFADLDQVVTVEKAVVSNLRRLAGHLPGDATRRFGETIARHFGRPALPDDLALALQRFKDRVVEKHGRLSPEGSALTALHEIRLLPRPDWNGSAITVILYFIVPAETLTGIDGKTVLDKLAWERWIGEWEKLLEPVGRIQDFASVPVTYSELDALTYRSSDPLDIEYLSP